MHFLEHLHVLCIKGPFRDTPLLVTSIRLSSQKQSTRGASNSRPVILARPCHRLNGPLQVHDPLHVPFPAHAHVQEADG